MQPGAARCSALPAATLTALRTRLDTTADGGSGSPWAQLGMGGGDLQLRHECRVVVNAHTRRLALDLIRLHLGIMLVNVLLLKDRLEQLDGLFFPFQWF